MKVPGRPCDRSRRFSGTTVRETRDGSGTLRVVTSQEFGFLPTVAGSPADNLRGDSAHTHPRAASRTRIAIVEDPMTIQTTPLRGTEQQWQYETPMTGGLVVGFDGSPASH